MNINDGAGPQAISDSTGMSIDKVRDLILAEEELYPRVNKFDQEVERSIEETSSFSGRYIGVDGISCPVQIGEWFCPTGTRYVWSQHETPSFLKDRGKYVGFSPTERKNWPVQGLGGEIVQTMVGKVFRDFSRHDNYSNGAYMINTVHDCLLIDAHTDVYKWVIDNTKAILEKVPNVFNYYFDMKIDVPFPVSVEVGLNWYDMEHYNA